MLQIDLLLEHAYRREAAMYAAAAARRLARGQAPVRVQVGVLLIRLGQRVAGDPRRVTAWQSEPFLTPQAASR